MCFPGDRKVNISRDVKIAESEGSKRKKSSNVRCNSYLTPKYFEIYISKGNLSDENDVGSDDQGLDEAKNDKEVVRIPISEKRAGHIEKRMRSMRLSKQPFH